MISILKKLTIIQVILLTIELILIVLWIFDDSLNYEAITVLLGTLFFISTKIDMNNNESLSSKEKKTSIANSKDITKSYHTNFIDGLPSERKKVYIKAHEKLDTGVTLTMRDGASEIIYFLKDVWVQLSEFYKSDNFNKNSSVEYIEKYIEERYSFHWAKYMPNGEYNIGTMGGNLVDSAVISDLEREIIEVVFAISISSDFFDYLKWKKEWIKIY